MTYWTEPRVFRKRPVAVEAMQWTGGRESAQLVMNWAHNHGVKILWTPGAPEQRLDDGTLLVPEKPEHLLIPTLEGEMEAYFGDYIIKEPFPTDDRKFYPCKAAIFEQTYVAADADNEALVRRVEAVIGQVAPLGWRVGKTLISRIATALADAHMLAPPDTEPASLARPEPLHTGMTKFSDGSVRHTIRDADGKTFPAFRERVLEDPEARAAYEQAREEFEALDQRVSEAEQSGQTEAIDQEDTY